MGTSSFCAIKRQMYVPYLCLCDVFCAPPFQGREGEGGRRGRGGGFEEEEAAAEEGYKKRGKGRKRRRWLGNKLEIMWSLKRESIPQGNRLFNRGVSEFLSA